MAASRAMSLKDDEGWLETGLLSVAGMVTWLTWASILGYCFVSGIR